MLPGHPVWFIEFRPVTTYHYYWWKHLLLDVFKSIANKLKVGVSANNEVLHH